jgi:hypothetical protein
MSSEPDSIVGENHAIHLCANWARENCGLEFKMLRKGGVIWVGVEAINIVFQRDKP